MRPVYPQAAKNDGKLWLEYGVCSLTATGENAAAVEGRRRKRLENGAVEPAARGPGGP